MLLDYNFFQDMKHLSLLFTHVKAEEVKKFNYKNSTNAVVMDV